MYMMTIITHASRMHARACFFVHGVVFMHAHLTKGKVVFKRISAGDAVGEPRAGNDEPTAMLGGVSDRNAELWEGRERSAVERCQELLRVDQST